MGLISKLLLLTCCLACFRSKKWYTKSENEAAYEAGFETGNKAKCDAGYEYEYQYYQDLWTGYECNRDSDCLESGRPKCLSGVCHELTGGVLIIGGVLPGARSITDNVAKIGECPVNVNNLPQASSSGATAIYDNLVFQCGGDGTGKCYIRSSSGQWTEGPELHNKVTHFTLNKVGSTLVAIGGWAGYALSSIEILHPGYPAWQLQTYTIAPARYSHCAATISSTQLMIVGGSTQSWTKLAIVDMINTNTGLITRYADLPHTTYAHACVLHQGRIFVVGGRGATEPTAQVFTLDYSNQGNSWSSASSLVSARELFSLEVIYGIPTAFGGRGTETSMEQYVGGVWKSQVFTVPRGDHTSVVIC